MVAAIRAELKKREDEAERARVSADATEIRARCQSLAGFVREAWHVLEPVAALQWNWHLDVICAHLEAITRGTFTAMGLPNRLLINVPPGSMKSLLVSVFWPAWEWGPMGLRSLRYLTASFEEDNAKRDTRRMRDLILSAWFNELWPELRLVRTGEMSIANSDTGARDCSAFGSLTAKRADRLLLDDPHSVKTAESDAERATSVRLFREGAVNRLNDVRLSAIVVIMQRLHTEDIAGTIQRYGMDFIVISLPMEHDPAFVCETPLGFPDPRTYAGELLDPVRFPPAEVARLKRDMGPYAYAGQYQQQPVPREGAFFMEEWFPRFRRGSQPEQLRIYLTSDHAPTAGPKSDANGVRVWGVDAAGDLWMLGGKKGRMRLDQLASVVLGNLKDPHREPDEPMLEGLVRTWKPFAWFPEDDNNWKAVEPFVLRRAKEEGVFVRIEPISPNGADKPTRAQAAQAMAAMGRVHIPEGSEGDEAVHELVHFLMSAHDEEVDLLAVMCRALDMAHPAIVPPEKPKPAGLKTITNMTWDEALKTYGGQAKPERI